MIHLHKTYLTAVITFCFCVAVSVALGFFLHITAKLGNELYMRIEAIANNTAREKVYLDLQKLVDATATQRTELRSVIITEVQMSSFLTDLETLGSTQGVALVTDSLEVKKQSGIFDLLTIRFSISGNETDVSRMIMLFETLPYVNNIMKLTIEHSESGTKANIELVVIVLKENV